MTPDSGQHPGSGQARGLSVSSGTDSELITPNDVASAGVTAFRAQSARTRSRFPDMRETVVAPGDGVGGWPGQRDVQRVGGGGEPAEVDQEAQIVVLVGRRLTGAEGGGDVPGDQLALPLGVLGGHAADLAGAGQVGDRRAVPAGVDVRGAGHGHELIDH